MAQFSFAVPFEVGETWCRRNFFSPDMKPIGEDLKLIAVSAPDLPVIIESAVAKTEAEGGWGGKMPVVEVHVRLASPAVAAGLAIATIQVDVEGPLLSCGDVSDACEAGSSG